MEIFFLFYSNFRINKFLLYNHNKLLFALLIFIMLFLHNKENEYK